MKASLVKFFKGRKRERCNGTDDVKSEAMD